MSISLIKSLQNFFHLIVNQAQAEIVLYATPALDYIEKNGGAVALTLGETFLAAAVAGTPWATLVANFEEQALAAGISLAKGAGAAILNYAQTNMIAKGTLQAPIAVAA